MKIQKTLLMVGVILFPTITYGQSFTGVYVGAGVGGNALQDARVHTSLSLLHPSSKERFDNGFVGLASVGYGFGNGIRVEIEGDYRYNHLHRLSGPLKTAYKTGGDRHQAGMMVNVLYDFHIDRSPFVPYLGAGVGYQWATNSSLYGYNANDVLKIRGTDGNFAYQGIAGLSYPVKTIPGLALTGEYRFLGTEDPSFDALAQSTKGSRTGIVMDRNINHALMLGVRYHFGSVSSVKMESILPPPVKVVAPVQSYLVFFDWNRIDLNARAQQIIAQAAETSRRVDYTIIEVSGHTDLSGSTTYNQQLSYQRAERVAAELVRNGIAKDIISINAYGEEHPLVPTKDGVRDSRNRRVEIVLK